MNIFKNKINTYKINCYLDKTNMVRGVAEKYAIPGSVVEVRSHGSLLKDNVRVTVSFKSKDSEPVIYKAILENFKHYDIKINKKSISIYKEQGF